ncbi:MAG: thioredoxin [Bacteroidota bacterium]|nr:thioredoxin [Bacteroidota bacterium]
MIWYIVAGVVLLLIIYMVYGYNKIKNTKDAPPSKNIRILNNKNYKTITRKGLVIVDFWAEWCAPCKMIAPILNEIADEQAGNITIAKVNVEQQKQLAQSYNIRNIPTMIIYKNGKELKRIMGAKTKKALLKEVGLG